MASVSSENIFNELLTDLRMRGSPEMFNEATRKNTKEYRKMKGYR
ncbi:hypothetical protein IGI37_001413 [Enterococcus sp. AZ194]